MPIRPRKTRFGSATIGAAMALGEINPLKKATEALGGGPPKKRLGKVDRPKATPKVESAPRATQAPRPKSGFGGVTRKDSPSKRKMRRGRRGGPRAY